MQWESPEWTGSWWAGRNGDGWEGAVCESDGDRQAGFVQVGMKEKGIPKGMNHIRSTTKAGKGKEYVW